MEMPAIAVMSLGGTQFPSFNLPERLLAIGGETAFGHDHEDLPLD